MLVYKEINIKSTKCKNFSCKSNCKLFENGRNTNLMHGTCQIDVMSILMVVCDILSQSKEDCEKCEKCNKIILKSLFFCIPFGGGGGCGALLLFHLIGVLSLVSFYLGPTHSNYFNYNGPPPLPIKR